MSTSASPCSPRPGRLGTPRVHLRLTDSTNTRARELAAAGAPDGTLVTAAEQSAGRGRQGRGWSAPPSTSLLCSLVVREPPPLLSLIAGVAVAATADQVSLSRSSPRPSGAAAQIKWPNDVLVDGRKIAGILVEGRPQENWAVLGIGLNVAVSVTALPPELSDSAGTLGLEPTAIEPVLAELLVSLERWCAVPSDEVLEALRARDALRGHKVGWDGDSGVAAGIDDEGRLLVDTERGRVALDAGEVHLSGRC